MFKQNAQHERKRVKTLIMVMFSGGIMDNFRSLLSRPMFSPVLYGDSGEVE